MNDNRRVLSIAVASGRVGHVLLEKGKIIDLGMSRKASSDAATAYAYTAQQIESLRPDIVVTERVLKGSKKGQKTRDIIAAITAVAELADVKGIEVVRGRTHDNRFEEARELADRLPAMRPYLPRERKPWEAEPKTLIYFEALSLIECLLGTSRHN